MTKNGERRCRSPRLAMISGLALLVLGAAREARAYHLAINGFASIFGSDTLTDISDNTAKPHDLNFTRDTRVGLNLRSDFSDQWSAVIQLVASGDRIAQAGSNPNWVPHVDWAFVSYTPVRGTNIKAGRQLFPNWLVAEYIDVGYAYPWVRPPDQVYDLAPFKSFEGASASYQWVLGDRSLILRAFGGDSRDSAANNETSSIDANYILGAALNLDGDGWHIQATGARFNSEFSTNLGFSAGSQAGPGAPVISQPVILDLFADGTQTVTAGARYDRGGIMAYAEYGRAWADHGTPINGSTFARSLTGYYGTVGYHLGAWLPHYTYAYGDWDSGLISGIQRSHIIGLNCMLDPSVALKSEYLWEQSVGGAMLLTGIGVAQSVTFGLDIIF